MYQFFNVHSLFVSSKALRRWFVGFLVALAVNLSFSNPVFSQTLVPLPIGAELQLEREVRAKPIEAWIEFCQRESQECALDTSEPTHINVTPSVWSKIVRINSQVNNTIVQKTDDEIYKTEDYWTLPYNGEGDCEDFQLLKRQLLVKAGLPARAMRMTVVVDEEGLGHAVLTILTDRGDYILDNKTSRIRTFDQTPYQYVKRESQNFVGWISLRGAPVSPNTTANR